MKKLTLSLLIISTCLASFALNGGEKYKIDTEKSRVEWLGRKVSGQHEGTIAIQSGELTIENGLISKGTIVIDMNSISVSDIKHEGTNKKLIGHLKSDDFFGVEQHATATLTIINSKMKNDKELEVTANLNIKGVSKEIMFPIALVTDNGNLGAVGSLEIDRTNFNIRYGSGQFFEDLGDKMIYDDFKIKFKVGAKL